MMYPKPQKSKKHDRMQSKNRARLLNQLSEELQDTGVYGCEVCHLEHEQGKRSVVKKGCESIIDPAHRHERQDYYNRPEMLWTRNQVIFAGRAHHNELDKNKEYREAVFQELRGDDLMKATNEN